MGRENTGLQGEHGHRDGQHRLTEVYVPHAEGELPTAFVTDDGVHIDMRDLVTDQVRAEARYTPEQARQLARRLVELADTADTLVPVER